MDGLLFLACLLATTGFALLLGKKAVEQKSKVIEGWAPAAGAMVESSKAALTEADQELTELIAAIEGSAKEGSLLIRRLWKNLRKGRPRRGGPSRPLIIWQSPSARRRKPVTIRSLLSSQASLISRRERHGRKLRPCKSRPPPPTPLREALTERLAWAEYFLNGLIGWKEMNLLTVKERANDISAATAQTTAMEAISAAALVLGFYFFTNSDLSKRIAAVKATLDAAYLIQKSEADSGSITTWRPADAVEVLRFGGKINRIRFAPNATLDSPLLAAACEDNRVGFSRKGSKPRGVQTASHAINDIAFQPEWRLSCRGERWEHGSDPTVARNGLSPESPPVNIENVAFEKHSDSVTDVEFNSNGDSGGFE